MEVTLKDLKDLLLSDSGNEEKCDTSVWEVGKKYLIRTVTMIQVGKLEKVTDKELVLSSASWIADTGRFNETLKSGEFNEVEPFSDDVIIGRSAIIDAQKISFKLPEKAK